MSKAYRQALGAAQAEHAALLIKRGNIVDELAETDRQITDVEQLITLCEARVAGSTPEVEATAQATAPAEHAGDTGVPAAPPRAAPPPRQLTDSQLRVWRALTEILDQGNQPTINFLTKYSRVPRGSVPAMLMRLAERGLIRRNGEGWEVLQRPADMPTPPQGPLRRHRPSRRANQPRSSRERRRRRAGQRPSPPPRRVVCACPRWIHRRCPTSRRAMPSRPPTRPTGDRTGHRTASAASRPCGLAAHRPTPSARPSICPTSSGWSSCASSSASRTAASSRGPARND